MKIKLFGLDFEINEADSSTMSGYCGQIKMDCQTILLQKDLPVQTKQKTLLHEVCHAMLDNYQIGSRFKTADTEIICEVFANGMFQVLKDNKELFTNMLKEI